MNAASTYRTSIILSASQTDSEGQQKRRRTFVAVDWNRYKAECESLRSPNTTPQSTLPDELPPKPEFDVDPRRSWKQTGARSSKLSLCDANSIIALLFFFGSLFFVANGFFTLLPLTNPELTFRGEAELVAPITNLLGALFFTSGSLLSLPTIWNTPSSQTGTKDTQALDKLSRPVLITDISWRWLPTRGDLKSVMAETPFQSAIAQMFGVIVLFPSVVTGFPGVLNTNDLSGFSFGVFGPLFLGGSLFFVSSVIMLVYTQERWYLPAFLSIVWQASLLNALGSLGFALAGAFLLLGNITTGTLMSFAGSWAFLCASLLQGLDLIVIHEVS
ncbi:uncharacterized protein JN550_006888 [Neoarthrinium moseri]|uniref:uncharacterized protein n=1 Tax=Neoarthrinium moseri TaxID=1658444 RepID=UPI001FDE7256|nr:uncharacterized protein JN550_006888 [Neoarthrinium moseri]KAI1867747.1 hypothetical protein JN550_006888 [Neoarthrinium moseri]